MDPRKEITRLKVEIDRRRAELEPLLARRNHLLSVLDGPRVQPVLVYTRYGQRENEPYEPYSNTCTLEAAFGLLYEMADQGHCAPAGVSVGGALISFDDWFDSGHE